MGRNGQGAQPRVLVVDHDQAVRNLMLWQLEAEGFLVDGAADRELALREIDAHLPDVIVVGLAVRILMLTGEADDYLPKPFSPRELAARVRALCPGGDGSVRSR